MFPVGATQQQPQQEPLPPYHPGDHTDHTQQIQSTVVELDLLSRTLDNINEYSIQKSSRTTKYAVDKNNAKLFAYSEELRVLRDRYRDVTFHFSDNSGREFLQADLDNAGMKVYSEIRQLGVIESTGCNSFPYRGNSVLGLGSVEFHGQGWAACVLICFPCCCGADSNFNIIIDGKKSGEFVSEDGKRIMRFNPGLDSRIKGLAVVLSFMDFR